MQYILYSYRFPTGLDGSVNKKMSLLSQLSGSISTPLPCGTMTLFTTGIEIISPYYLQDYYSNLKRAQDKAIEEEAIKKAEKEARKVRYLTVLSIL